ncbi:MAG: 2-amino-4-hydroxy-6-hydroxymethyldihydropteridine diphosphokinase [Pirellulaceae bacterium]
MAQCLLGLGSNLGDRATQLDRAAELLCGDPQIHCIRRSTYHTTRPIGGPPRQDEFLNAAIRMATQLSPEQVLAAVRDVEQRMGRHRAARWGPRVIDIDVLLYDQEVVATKELSVPHPRMAVRRFVLEPANEVGSEMIHPLTGWTVAELLQRLRTPPHFVSIAGIDARHTRNLALMAAQLTGAHPLLDPVAEAGASFQENTWPGEVQIARREAQALAARRAQLSDLWAAARTSPHQWYVSDYWLPQSCAVARAWLQGTAREDLERAAESAARQVPLPHCVMFLDQSPENGGGQRAAAASSIASLPPTYEARLVREMTYQASLQGQGPLLHVPAADLRLALTELTAAIDAMR